MTCGLVMGIISGTSANAERRHHNAPAHVGHQRSFAPQVHHHAAPRMMHRPITRVAPVVQVPRHIGNGHPHRPRGVLPLVGGAYEYAVPVPVPAPVSVFVDVPAPAREEFLEPLSDPAPLVPRPPEYGRVITVKTTSPIAPTQERPGNVAAFDLSKLPLTSFKWRREGGFMLADFKIQNLNAFSVADIVVRCTYAIQTFSGYSVEGNEQTLTQAIDPAATSDLTNVNMGAIGPDITTTQCGVVRYAPAS